VKICGLGLHELTINGKRVGDHQLDPAWTDYASRVFYVTHDVTQYLHEGGNAIGVMLGRGFYGLLSNDAWNTEQAIWLGQPKLLLKLQVQYEDGTREEIVSNSEWKVAGGPIVYDCPRRGEIFDATREQAGWDTPRFDDSGWENAQTAPAPSGKLVPQDIPPIRELQAVKAVSFSEPSPGVYVYDFGKNVSGWARIQLEGKTGERVLIRYSEKSSRADFFCDNLAIYQEHAWKLDGKERVLEPRFSYVSFRYLRVSGSSDPLTKDSVEAVMVHTDLETTGTFECSNPMLNQLHEVIRLTQLNNTHGQPTDCPHREKQGWMGDGLFGAEAAFW